VLRHAARTDDGKLTAVAVAWLPGESVGGFDFKGRRSDDPNDRIPHQDRRSLRASLLLFAWMNESDPSPINTFDSYVSENGRRFVRHYIIDFGDALGSSGAAAKAVYDGRERILEFGRMMAAFFTLGIYRRDWQRDAKLWRLESKAQPAAGWIFPVESWEPSDYRAGRKNQAHLRMTRRDGYWGAKLVTSFGDADIAAVVKEAGYQGEQAAFIDYALRLRRDRIAETYLLPMTALERPDVSPDGKLCFEDLAIARGYAAPLEVRYQVRLADGRNRERGTVALLAAGPRTCVPLVAPGDYQIVSVQATVAGKKARAARVHLRRGSDGRLAVVGVEREES
jgi:hypothetical protein